MSCTMRRNVGQVAKYCGAGDRFLPPALYGQAGRPLKAIRLRADKFACPTQQHSRNQALVLIPGRPISNRPQVANLPHKSLQAATILRSSSTIAVSECTPLEVG
jgi:hypothetical protein